MFLDGIEDQPCRIGRLIRALHPLGKGLALIAAGEILEDLAVGDVLALLENEQMGEIDGIAGKEHLLEADLALAGRGS